jgi:hypothetical protein
MPMDIVAVRTKRHSCTVEGKHSGLLPASAGGSSIDGKGSPREFTAARAPSTVAIVLRGREMSF